jgi:hypothetical protein
MNAEATDTTAGTAADARAALVNYFTSQGLTFGDGPNGEIVVPFDMPGHRLLVTARADDQPDAGIWLQMVSAELIDREHWAATLVAVNQWNTLVRSPRAVLRVGDWNADSQATLTLDEWLPFGASGAEATQIEQVAGAMLAASSYFATTSPLRPRGDVEARPPG